MTHGQYLAIVAKAKKVNESHCADESVAVNLCTANQLLAKVATLNFADELIVADIEAAQTILDQISP